jgi:hypothetical protein
VLQHIAVHGDRIIAVGRQTSHGVTTPLAEVSTDDGATWAQADLRAASADSSS